MKLKKLCRDAQKDPKGFYQLYRAKAKEGIGPLRERERGGAELIVVKEDCGHSV